MARGEAAEGGWSKVCAHRGAASSSRTYAHGHLGSDLSCRLLVVKCNLRFFCVLIQFAAASSQEDTGWGGKVFERQPASLHRPGPRRQKKTPIMPVNKRAKLIVSMVDTTLSGHEVYVVQIYHYLTTRDSPLLPVTRK